MHALLIPDLTGPNRPFSDLSPNDPPAFWLLVAWAYWIDKNRTVVAESVRQP